MTSEEAAKLGGVSWILARKWAYKNGVAKEGAGRGQYIWTDEDVDKFLARNKQRGRPKKIQGVEVFDGEI